jgi:phosphopantothenoylcysteine decarboxylase / phosphopantothenate---cysteine ligase
MQALSNHPVYTDMWDARAGNNMAHIKLSRDKADAVVVAPASADFIAKLVQGRADDLLSLLCLARPRLPAAGGAGDEPRDVGAPGDAAQRRTAAADGATVLGPAAATRPAARPATAACSRPMNCATS